MESKSEVYLNSIFTLLVVSSPFLWIISANILFKNNFIGIILYGTLFLMCMAIVLIILIIRTRSKKEVNEHNALHTPDEGGEK